jgi:hypothetical protein
MSRKNADFVNINRICFLIVNKNAVFSKTQDDDNIIKKFPYSQIMEL